MQLVEKRAKGVCEELVDYTNLWDEFFKHINGIGKVIASTLIAEIQDIGKFPTVSSLWAYFGLTAEYVIAHCEHGHKIIMASDKRVSCPILKPIKQNDNNNNNNGQQKEVCGGKLTIIERVHGKSPKRKEGYHFLFNTKGKTLAWKIAQQFIKQGDDVYKDIYYKEKEKQARLNPELKKGHIHNRAMRRMVKVFLSHLWEAWRKVEGFDTRPPYVIEKLGHGGYLSWAELKEQLKEAKQTVKTIDE